MKLIELIKQHPGAPYRASPEYNSLITPLLKNTIDWCTRGDDNPFEEGKVTPPGSRLGVAGAHWRRSFLKLAQQLLLHLGAHVVPGNSFLPHADKAFDAAGKLTEVRSEKSVRTLATALVALTQKLST